MRVHLILTLIVLAAFPALAEDPPLPPLTPEGEYLVLTQDDATSTSKCIGNPVTPLCAVETVMACYVRNDYELCRIGMGLDSQHGINKGRQQPSKLYRVIRSEVLGESNFPWRPESDLRWRPGEPSIQASDVRIDLLYHDCPWQLTREDCHFGQIVAYIMRRQNNYWAVTTWGNPNDPRN